MRWRWVIAVVAVAAVAVAAVLALRGDDRPAPRAGPTAAPPPAPGVAAHLRALTAAAGTAGTRAAGTAGDAATRRYVVAALRAAGWRVTEQPVRFPYFDERSPPRVVPAGGGALAPGRDVRTLAYSAPGTARGAVRAVAGGSAAGCRARDFRRLRAGEVALVRRGTCRMSVKARHAQAAGAAAVVVFNDGAPGRRAAIAGTLGAPGLRIPAVFASTSAARRLRAAGRVSVAVDAVSEQRSTANVVAETGSGPRVAIAGAHLDSVPGGPGLNDDGSGIAALLTVAARLGGRAPQGSRLRLGFWAAEELGLYGSRRYVASLSRAERDTIAGYVNLDMVGTRGGEMAVYEGDAGIRDALRRGLRERGRDDVGTEDLGPSSDHAPFAQAGIPVGGIFTGLDRCYHRACDDAGNVDPRRVADAAAATAATLAEVTSAAG